MDFHPIIVHFPIALLALYCALEFLRFEKMQKHFAWFYMKMFLLIAGAGSAAFALQTGESAERKYDWAARQLIRVHSSWASATTMIFSVLAFAYLMKWLEKDFGNDPRLLKLKSDRIAGNIFLILNEAADFIMRTPVVIALAVLGFLGIFITGALGGAIVYGPDADIFVSFVYHLFF